ncbi:hypothetical protein RHSIM_Rhsim09G0055600 [Rhododendron simsii]|uniref:BHLH domain-containing protein n=1 Tax=Rhododendron simsii TaxID=118357 RepID=A0A834LE12_RHOSS|nr:hypothetical protein RHSIM_Rhsim09G0055600 [Rhododendron simsii]
MQGNFQGADYSIDHHHQLMKPRINEETYVDASNQIADYTSLTSHPRSSTSPDKLSFADVMQFADFGPRLGLINQTKIPEEGQEEEVETGIDDPVYFLRFPVLNEDRYKGLGEERGGGEERGDGEGRGNSENNNNATSEGLGIVGGNFEKNLAADDHGVMSNKNKRKRARSVKTSEEVESQRMTHIAVERNRRKQMNEHLRVLRSLMPGSYVQRGDQASIIGGAIEFVRELEQLLQCLESQKRRRLYGDPPPPRPMGDSSTSSLANIPQPSQTPPPFFPPPVVPSLLPNSHDNQLKLVEFDPTAGLREETAESKSVLADVEVKMLGFDAMIKILSRRRPGQLIKTIAALEDLQLIILHTNITTIEQTVLYSFNVKVTSEARFSADDIASSVQQIFSFIHANNTM